MGREAGFTALISSVLLRNPRPSPQSPGFLSVGLEPWREGVRALAAGPQPALLSQRPGQRGVCPSSIKKAPQAMPTCSQGGGHQEVPCSFEVLVLTLNSLASNVV